MNTLLYLIFFIPLTAAASLDSEYAQKLARARTPSQVQKWQDEYQTLKILRAACQLQLRRQNIPSSCYELFAAEKAWGLHHSKVQQKRVQGKLDHLCATAARDVNTELRVRKPLSVSAECEQEVRRHEQIRLYRSTSSDWSEY